MQLDQEDLSRLAQIVSNIEIPCEGLDIIERSRL